MTKDEARKELLETLEEYCHDKGYGLQMFAGLSDLVYTLYPLQKKMTNADKIRRMADAELANFMDKLESIACDLCAYNDDGVCFMQHSNCRDGFLMWLQQEAKDNDK